MCRIHKTEPEMETITSNAENIERAVRTILTSIGEDPNREGLKGTPDRIVRMYKEIFRGYDPAQKPKITTFSNDAHSTDIVFDKGEYYSLCEHHMMPFFGKYVFAYIPNPKGRILGISKIGRVVDYHSARLQVQERLVADIVEDITKALGEDYPPLGVALMMQGEHLCKTMRGVKKPGKMSACRLEGIFREEPAARAEFMAVANKLLGE